MKNVELASWAEFSERVFEIRRARERLQASEGRAFSAPLFRGLGDSDWGLETTLERAFPLELSEEIRDLPTYYNHIYRSKSSVETLTDADWGDLPDPPEVVEELEKFSALGLRFFFIRNRPLYRYLIYLRHHGYPSPLLDWTSSPYVAAFFAFDAMPQTAHFVSVYSMLRDGTRHSSFDIPTVDIMGPFIRTHRRHLIQQSQYSICTLWPSDYKFYAHDQALAQDGALGIKGELVRITIPAQERTVALSDLDQMNINAFSLFGSEDSLVRTVARREGLLRSK